MLRMVTRLLVAWAVVHCAYGYLDIIDVEPQIDIVSPSLLIPPPQIQILPPPPQILLPPPQILPLPAAPPYRSSAKTVVDVLNFVKREIDLPLTPAKRNLITIVFAIRVASHGVASGLSYDAAYSTTNEVVLLAKLMTEAARELLVTRYDDKLKKLEPVLNLIENICPNGFADYNCDLKVDRIIKRNPIYKQLAILLLESGKLCELFNQNKIQILKAAVEDRAVEYLSKNKYVLKPFVDQNAIDLNLQKRL